MEGGGIGNWERKEGIVPFTIFGLFHSLVFLTLIASVSCEKGFNMIIEKLGNNIINIEGMSHITFDLIDGTDKGTVNIFYRGVDAPSYFCEIEEQEYFRFRCAIMNRFRKE